MQGARNSGAAGVALICGIWEIAIERRDAGEPGIA
jgi:hypothetical protein